MTRSPVAGQAPGAVTIRPVTSGDVAAIAAIEARVFPDPWTRTAFEALLENPRVFFRVAAGAGNEIVGYVVAWFVLDEGEVANVAVSPERQGQRIGRSMLDAAVAAGAAAGVRRFFLEVRDSNEAARAMYDSCGFVHVSRRRDYYRRPVEDALVLRLDVTDEGPAAKPLPFTQQK